MSLVRNSIPIQNKSMGDQISFMEWNKVVNQLSTQANMLTNATENIIENYFNFVWLPNNETRIPNGVDIIIIPDNSLGDLVTNEETLANYFNKEDSQYLPAEWKYRIIKYKRGTRVLEILSTGVMKLTQEKLEDLINSRFDEIEDIIENKESEVDIMIGAVSVYTEEGPFAGFRTIDGHTLQKSDTILVVGNGSSNGIYSVNTDGVWQRIQKVETFQVVSIDNGIVYGGSMQKKMEDGTTLQVKNPERPAWRILI